MSTRSYGIDQALPAKHDLSRYVRWPRYIRVQRQRAILQQRLKVPGQINQFTKTLDAHLAARAVAFCDKYKPESKAEKKARLAAVAGGAEATARPATLKFGVNHVTKLVEQKRAKLVLIAHDVDPIELVLCLPALCNNMQIPYAIVKGKSRLGQLVHQKTATCVAITDVNDADKADFAALTEAIKGAVDYEHAVRGWSTPKLGFKSQAIVDRLERRKALEQRKRAGKN